MWSRPKKISTISEYPLTRATRDASIRGRCPLTPGIFEEQRGGRDNFTKICQSLFRKKAEEYRAMLLRGRDPLSVPNLISGERLLQGKA